MSRLQALTVKQVQDIFLYRSHGKIEIKIGSTFGISGNSVNRILHRQARQEVPIASDILEKVRAQFKGPRKPPTATPSPADLASPVTPNTNSCVHLAFALLAAQRARCSRDVPGAETVHRGKGKRHGFGHWQVQPDQPLQAFCTPAVGVKRDRRYPPDPREPIDIKHFLHRSTSEVARAA